MHVRVFRVVSCLCTSEPLDDDDEPASLRYSECPIDRLLSKRRTPEVAYLCAKYGALNSYRCAAQFVANLPGLSRLCDASARKETIACGEYIEEEPFRADWFAGGLKLNGAQHLRVAIDGTVLRASPLKEVCKFEVIAGRVERDGHTWSKGSSVRFRAAAWLACLSLQRSSKAWVPSTKVDVVTDGARGMRALVASVAPCVAPKILDWFHLDRWGPLLSVQ